MIPITEPKVVPLYPKPAPEPACSFCGKKKSQAKKMFSNSVDKQICDVCITKAKEML